MNNYQILLTLKYDHAIKFFLLNLDHF